MTLTADRQGWTHSLSLFLQQKLSSVSSILTISLPSGFQKSDVVLCLAQEGKVSGHRERNSPLHTDQHCNCLPHIHRPHIAPCQLAQKPQQRVAPPQVSQTALLQPFPSQVPAL